ncbi:hypothetical protein MSG28_013491 [Choristoneura fumiferana]|uniref:Uncharacterized protein n=1 Tax=Choristoneura fumiferana TaxID=7141 RepID=A0ACC0KU25_CHOFU|nr:hypothetical protein MSG28_013491 [Choristoneura fumiferana]
MDNLSILTSDIRLAFSKKQHLVGCFLDISAAYDNVLLPVLRAKMLQLSIPARIVHFVCKLFIGRTIKIRSGNSFLPPRTLWQGLPQGSVLSPLLYNIYTYDIEQSVSPFCSILQYADDLVLYTSSQSTDAAPSKLNEALSYLKIWLDDHGLTLSPSKSCIVTFTRSRSIPIMDIRYDDEVIPCLDAVKFLGVFLDSKMTGVPHLEYVTSKCEKGINVLRALSGVWWGAHPYCQKLVYNAVIRSQFDYGSLVIEPCNKNALKKLDLIQAKCLRITLGAMKSSPKIAMQVECLDPPLSLRRQYLADRFIFKACSISNHPLLPRLEELSQEVSENTMAATCVVQPLDLIKTRMQLSGGARSSFAVAGEIVAREGFVSLYTGLSAGSCDKPLILPQGSGFTIYSSIGIKTPEYSTFFRRNAGAAPSFGTKTLLGVAAGSIGAFVGPAEVALIRMTADGRLPADQRRNYKNVADALIRIVRGGRAEAVARATPTVGRAMVVNAAQLSTYSQRHRIASLASLPRADGEWTTRCPHACGHNEWTPKVEAVMQG